MSVGGIDTGAGLSLPENLGANYSVFKFILFNNLSYNLCSFTQESVYLGKDSFYQR